MEIQHLRNATLILSIGDHHLLVDPMLSEAGAMPGFKLFGGGRRNNPLVALPESASEALERVSAVVITHEHPDHLDRPGLEWIKARGLRVFGNAVDAPNLRRRGLEVTEITDKVLNLSVEVIPSRHGRGLLGWMMGPVAGYYLAAPNEPSIYLTGDSILTDSVLEAIERLQPEVVVAPAGAANMGLGGDILFSVDELVELVRRSPGQVVLNHLEALDHCPVRREDLRARMVAEGFMERVHIPADGEVLRFEGGPTEARVAPQARSLRPGFQKWVTRAFVSV